MGFCNHNFGINVLSKWFSMTVLILREKEETKTSKHANITNATNGHSLMLKNEKEREQFQCNTSTLAYFHQEGSQFLPEWIQIEVGVIINRGMGQLR